MVLPWDKSSYDFDFTTATVNVVRRFTITENDPATFKKTQTADGYYDIKFWHTLNSQENIIKGDILVATPVGQKLHVVPVAGALDGCTKVDGIFSITPMEATIYPNYQHPEDGRIEDIIFGPFFICDCSTENFGSLSEEQLKRYSEQFQYPEHFFRDVHSNEIKAVRYDPTKGRDQSR